MNSSNCNRFLLSSLLICGVAPSWIGAQYAQPETSASGSSRRLPASYSQRYEPYFYNRGNRGRDYTPVYTRTSYYDRDQDRDSRYYGRNPYTWTTGTGREQTPGYWYGRGTPNRRYNDPIACSVVRAGKTTLRSPAQVRFDTVLADSGYSWDYRASMFNAIEPGVYYFTFSALSPERQHFRIALMLNGREVVSAWSDISGFQQASNSAILPLRRGDRVYLQLMEGQIEEAVANDRVYTSFSGFKIPNEKP